MSFETKMNHIAFHVEGASKLNISSLFFSGCCSFHCINISCFLQFTSFLLQLFREHRGSSCHTTPTASCFGKVSCAGVNFKRITANVHCFYYFTLICICKRTHRIWECLQGFRKSPAFCREYRNIAVFTGCCRVLKYKHTYRDIKRYKKKRMNIRFVVYV